MAFDVAAALKAGYSEKEIALHLGETAGFDAAGALEAGYSPNEIIGKLNPTGAGGGRGAGTRKDDAGNTYYSESAAQQMARGEMLRESAARKQRGAGAGRGQTVVDGEDGEPTYNDNVIAQLIRGKEQRKGALIDKARNEVNSRGTHTETMYDPMTGLPLYDAEVVDSDPRAVDARRTRWEGRLTDADIPAMTPGSVARDAASSAAQIPGVLVSGAGQLTRLATGDAAGKGLQRFGDGMNEWLRQNVTSERGQKQAIRMAQDMEDPAMNAADVVLDNKGAVADQALPQIGSMAIPLAGAVAAGKMVQGANALRIAAAGNAGRLAAAIDPAIRTAGVATARGAGLVGTTMAQNAADTYSTVKDEGGTDAEAYKGAAIAAGATLLANKLTAGGVEGAILRKELGKGPTALERIGTVALGSVKEFAQEGTEAAGGYVGKQVGLGQPITAEGLSKNAVLEGAMGALVGGGAHTIGATREAIADRAAAAELAKINAPAPTAPKVEDQPTTPQAPVVPKVPQVTDPIAPMDDGALLNAVPLEGGEQVQQPAQSAAVADEGAGVSQPTQAAAPKAVQSDGSVIPEPVDPVTKLRSEIEQIKAKAQQEIAAKQAEAEKVAAQVDPKAFAQSGATPAALPGAVPDTANRPATAVQAAQQRQAKYGDLSNQAVYPERALYGIINNPQAKPELKNAARAEVQRRRDIQMGRVAEAGPKLDFTPSNSVSPNAVQLSTMSPAAQQLQARMGVNYGNLAATGNAVGEGQNQTGQGQVGAVAGTQSANVTQTQYGGPGQPGGAFALGGTSPAATTAAPRRQPLRLAKPAPVSAIKGFKQLIDHHFGTDVTPRSGPLTDREQAASALLAMQGKTLVFLSDKNGNNKSFPDGVVNDLSGQHVAINGDRTEDSPFIIAFHEGAIHGLPPDLRDKWNQAVMEQLIDAGELTAASDSFLKKFKYEEGDVHEEIPAFVGQTLAKSRSFWEGVRTKLGEGDFKELVNHILKSLRAYVSGVNDAYGAAFVNKYLADVPALERLLQDLVVEHHNRVNKAQSQSQAGEKSAFALKASEDGEADDSRAEITQKDIPESVDAPATLESALKLAGSRVWNKGRDLKVAMQNAVQAAAKAAGVDVGAPSDATTKYLTRVGVKDALGALKQNANAVGWYDLKTRQALSVMALVHPELARDENARFAMVWAMAVTSNGLKVDKNFEIAEKVYQAYKETGEMPTRMGIGQAAGAINESLKQFNELKAKWGIDNLRQFMLTNFTVKEITGIAKELKPGGEHADVVVRGAAILGPKIGNGFFSNLYGNFDALTMDRWLIRTWGRWTGTLISPMEKQTAKAKDRLAANLEEIVKDPGESARLGEAINLDIRGDTPLDTLATAVQKASMDPATRKVMNATAVGEELRKAGNGLAKYLDGQKEAPAGPTERKYIRKVFGEILSQLHQDPAYKDLSMADLQAVLWYAEKRLYESSKDDPSEDEVEGYADNEAPDYAVAASDVARKAGVTERRIQNALEKEKQNGRTTDARRADGSAQTDRFGLKVSTGGFTEQKRKSFVEWQALKRIGDRRLGGKELSWAYEGESAGDGGRVRRLSDLGVTYVAEWKLGKKAKTVFKANGLTAISMFELAPGDATNAQKFADAITASKNGTPFGAAVYVYPTKSSEDETGYADMRLFLSKDGKNGVAVKRDGDIVSVFAEQRSGNSLSLLQVALAAGGRKLDAFDTVLPRIYSRHGFRVVARTEWNDEFAPSGWNKELFMEFNGGEPDVVFMAYDPAHGEMYETSDGKTYDGYDKAVAAQKRVVNKVAKDVPSSGPFFSRKAQDTRDLDQDIILEIPVEGGGTAKLTVNAKTYLEQLDRRQEALEMVKECML